MKGALEPHSHRGRRFASFAAVEGNPTNAGRKAMRAIVGAFLLACALMTAPTDAAGPKREKSPLILEEHRVFYVGGQTVHQTQPGLEQYEIRVGQAYVEAFIPQDKRKNAIPIIMTHSSSTGIIWLTTPDGREGWAHFFLRHGFPVYIVDPPGTGRSGFPADQYNRVRLGLDPPSSQPRLAQRGSEAWEENNVGPVPYEHALVDPTCIGNDSRGVPPVTCYGWRMPNDDESIKHWLAHRSFIEAPVPGGNTPAFVALLEKIGPAIWLGWSGGGSLGGDIVNTRPELFKALIGIEPASECLYDRDFPLTNIAKVPAFSIHGINQIGRPGVPSCRAKYAAVNAAGGNATWQSLYDLGIFGNSHMMFWEENNEEIAKLILDWIEDNLEQPKRRPHR
jgi:pimeloyl-ACP methyl ester carboxylesterase